MHVVVCSTNVDIGAFHLSQCPGKVGMEIRTHVVIEPAVAELRGEDEVAVHLAERLRHVGTFFCGAPSGRRIGHYVSIIVASLRDDIGSSLGFLGLLLWRPFGTTRSSS